MSAALSCFETPLGFLKPLIGLKSPLQRTGKPHRGCNQDTWWSVDLSYFFPWVELARLSGAKILGHFGHIAAVRSEFSVKI